MIFLLFAVVRLIRYLADIIRAIVRDCNGIKVFVSMMLFIKQATKKKKTINTLFQENLKKFPQKAAIEFYGQSWTFNDLDLYSNRVANLFSNKFKLKKGDCVALFMENCPEYVGIWLGLTKIGVISALINSNLKQKSLVHCISVAKAKVVVYSATLEKSILPIAGELDTDTKLIVNNDDSVKSETSDALVLNSTLEYVSDHAEYNVEEMNSNDILMYVYTSGTTGLPKPAIIKHSRYFTANYGVISCAAGVTSADKVLVVLPIYHGNGHFLGIGSCMVLGATVVLRKKFSASKFLEEAIATQSTAFIYVGEVCRFLANQPPSKLDRKHKLRVCIGNGMRKNVGEVFGRRFGIKTIEFYGATEGNCNMVNVNGRIGACGFLPLLNYVVRVIPICLIKMDEDMNPIRDENGFCIECARGEKGLLIGMIDDKKPTSAFSGYANNSKATNSKVIEDVFLKGQRAFNSGDLMVCDSLGYMTFSDRIGDTYRWKGENVATIEVENIISRAFQAIECVVYGVEIPGQEGRCGMVAVRVKEDTDFSLEKLAKVLDTNMAPFARPMFVRLTDNIEYTGTFKIKKTKLVEEGYNLDVVTDKVYYLEGNKAYKELTPVIYDKIKKSVFRI